MKWNLLPLRIPDSSHEDAFFHGACWHVECLNNLGNGWKQLWILIHSFFCDVSTIGMEYLNT